MGFSLSVYKIIIILLVNYSFFDDGQLIILDIMFF